MSLLYECPDDISNLIYYYVRNIREIKIKKKLLDDIRKYRKRKKFLLYHSKNHLYDHYWCNSFKDNDQNYILHLGFNLRKREFFISNSKFNKFRKNEMITIREYTKLRALENINYDDFVNIINFIDDCF